MPRDGTPPAASDVGRVVGGRYLLGELVGIGGMATVHRAFDTRFDRSVAVKLLRREIIEDLDIAMRFRREALAATVLRHPNIVACLEAGTDDGQPYLVMELVEGEDLAARLRRVGRLDPPEAARLGLDIARGLAVAHVRGIVHRDVKPGNILLARDGRAMVTDFGIARLAADAEGAIPGTTLGSVQYFSPEQARGATTTAASDVYGLGLVLYETLTGRRAWRADTTAALAAVRIGAPAPSPRAVRPEIPAALDEVVIRALDPDPSVRYPNGRSLAAALERIVGRPDPVSVGLPVGPPTIAGGGGSVAAAINVRPGSDTGAGVIAGAAAAVAAPSIREAAVARGVALAVDDARWAPQGNGQPAATAHSHRGFHRGAREQRARSGACLGRVLAGAAASIEQRLVPISIIGRRSTASSGRPDRHFSSPHCAPASALGRGTARRPCCRPPRRWWRAVRRRPAAARRCRSSGGHLGERQHTSLRAAHLHATPDSGRHPDTEAHARTDTRGRRHTSSRVRSRNPRPLWPDLWPGLRARCRAVRAGRLRARHSVRPS